MSEPREWSSSFRYAFPRCHCNGLGGDEEALGDVTVAHAAGGELGHLALPRGQRLGAAEALAARPGAGRHELLACASLQRRGLAPLGKVHAGAEAVAGLAPLAAPAQLRAEVDQRTCAVERSR